MPEVGGNFSGRSQYRLIVATSQGTQDVANNRTLVNWSLRITESPEWGSWSNQALTWSVNIGGNTKSGSTTYDFRNYNSLTLGSGSYWITHAANGTKSISYSASAGGGTTIGSASASGSFTLSTIPRASTSTWNVQGTKYFGSTYQINTNRASSSFTHDLYYILGSSSAVLIGSGVTTSYNWTIPSDLMTKVPNAMSISGKIRTVTKSGSTTIGTTDSSMALTVPTNDNTRPSWSETPVIEEAVASVSTLIGAGKYVQGVSKIKHTITGAEGMYGATITTRRVTVGSGANVQVVNGATGTTPNVINQSGTVPVLVEIIDSRGLSKSQTFNITVLPYAAPKINSVTVQRAMSTSSVDPGGQMVRVTLNVSATSLDNDGQKNKLSVKIFSREKGTASWGAVVSTPVNASSTLTYTGYVTLTGPYDVGTAYDIQVRAFDSLTAENINAPFYAIGVAAADLHLGKSGVGVGKYWERGALDVNGVIYAPYIRATGTGDVSLTSTGHGFQVGPDDGMNMSIDQNEILSRNNGDAGELNLQIDGGNINIGKTGGERVLIRPRIENPFTPYAMAAGIANVTSSFPVVTLPSGRFTEPPIITGQLYSGAGADIGVVVMVTNVTTTQFQCRHTASSGTKAVHWQAVQMNPGSANG